MQRVWKLLLFMIAGVGLLAACIAEGDVVVTVPETAVSKTAVSPQNEVAADQVVEAELATAVPAPTQKVDPTSTEAIVIEETAVQQEKADPAERPAGQTLNEYVNVSYTEVDEELVGKTNRAQFLLVYATW